MFFSFLNTGVFPTHDKSIINEKYHVSFYEIYIVPRLKSSCIAIMITIAALTLMTLQRVLLNKSILCYIENRTIDNGSTCNKLIKTQ